MANSGHVPLPPATLPNPGDWHIHLVCPEQLGEGISAPHLWSGLGLPFFRMLLAVVSLKCSRPTVTLVTCSGGRLTLGKGKQRSE